MAGVPLGWGHLEGVAGKVMRRTAKNAINPLDLNENWVD
jgi:hypothetical protein